MNTVRGARERARIEVTAAIKDEARRRLAAEGAAKLSLRAVARELGMVSSALYRYFPSRDELLTALIIDAYDSVGAAAEQADARALEASAPPRARWIAVCEAVRAWALEHPHEYALIYGSPVPGYSAPQDTVGPASRVGNTLIAVLRSAYEGRGLALPPLPAALRPEAARMTADFAQGLPPRSPPRWSPPGRSWSASSPSSCSDSSTGSSRTGTPSSRTPPGSWRTGSGCRPYDRIRGRPLTREAGPGGRSTVRRVESGGCPVRRRPCV